VDPSRNVRESGLPLLLQLCSLLPEYLLDTSKSIQPASIYRADNQGVPVEHIFIPFTFAIGILLLDEGRKYVVRRYPKGILARIAW
jgi:hypothetical protein